MLIYCDIIPPTLVSASLPAPQNVKMIAMDMNYMLHWDWNYTQLENPVTFTTDYV